MTMVRRRTGTIRRTGILQQAPDGVWYLTVAGEHRHRIGGWEHLIDVARGYSVSWQSPSDLSRFRAQYGEPPPGAGELGMTVTLP